MKHLLKEFAEVPGAILLAMLALFHAFVVSSAERDDVMNKVDFLENQQVQIAAALDQTVVVVNALAFENAPYKDSRAPLTDKIPGEFYKEPKPEGPGHFPPPMAHRVVEEIEIWCLVIAIVLFLAGLNYRISQVHRTWAGTSVSKSDAVGRPRA